MWMSSRVGFCIPAPGTVIIVCMENGGNGVRAKWGSEVAVSGSERDEGGRWISGGGIGEGIGVGVSVDIKQSLALANEGRKANG